jgi:hypothetical protein
MKPNDKPIVSNVLIAITLFGFILAGCAGQTVQKAELTSERQFEMNMKRLVEDVDALKSNTPMELVPVVVMPGSIKTGLSINRLEEYVMDQLQLRLRKQHDIYTLTRQNWFEYRESEPLGFNHHSKPLRDTPDYLVIYEVGASIDEVLKKIKVHIVATDLAGNAIPGVVAEADFDFYSGAPAHGLYHTRSTKNLFPEGLEERPYQSIDRLAYSLSTELTEAYRYGLTAGDQTPNHNEVRVALYVNPPENVSPSTVRWIQDSLQHSIVSRRGFTCAVSRKDFAHFFRQIDFYKMHKKLFQLEESPLAAGTVLMMVDIFKHPEADKVGVALRAVWRVNPLESNEDKIIKANVAGTYLSGFTAKAYLKAAPKSINRVAVRLHRGFE